MLRRQLSFLRLGFSKLEIELGNHTREPRIDGIGNVPVCPSNQTEFEYHFLLCCPKYMKIYHGQVSINLLVSWPRIIVNSCLNY